MFERSFDWLKAKLGVSDEQVHNWEEEAKNEAITAAQAALEAAHQVVLDAEAKVAELTAPEATPEVPVEPEADGAQAAE